MAIKDEILNAETKANNWLARANELREAGKSDAKAMEQAQKWLDKLNELEENSVGCIFCNEFMDDNHVCGSSVQNMSLRPDGAERFGYVTYGCLK